MYKRLKLCFGIIIFIAVVTVAAVMFFQNKPIVERVSNPRIAFISATVGQDGAAYDCDIFESDISDELNGALISLFLKSEMKRTCFPPSQIYTVSEDSVYITIKILLGNSDSPPMFVNLCTIPQYNSAQIGGTYYHIIDHQKLYEDVYGLLSNVISTYAEKR